MPFRHMSNPHYISNKTNPRYSKVPIDLKLIKFINGYFDETGFLEFQGSSWDTAWEDLQKMDEETLDELLEFFTAFLVKLQAKDTSNTQNMYDEKWFLKPECYLRKNYFGDIEDMDKQPAWALDFSKTQADIETIEGFIVLIKRALQVVQEKNDRMYNEANRTNSLIDFVLKSPNNGITTPDLIHKIPENKKAQRVSDVITWLSEDILKKLEDEILKHDIISL